MQADDFFCFHYSIVQLFFFVFFFFIHRDVVKHKVISSESEKVKTEIVTSSVKRSLTFPALEDVLKFDYKSPEFARQLKRNGPTYVVVKILQRFRDTEKRDPNPKNRDEDLVKLLKIRDEIASGLVPDTAFVHVFAQISPVAAIVGGELSQEIIKAVSQKETPNRNVFLFNPDTCCGFVECIEA